MITTKTYGTVGGSRMGPGAGFRFGSRMLMEGDDDKGGGGDDDKLDPKLEKQLNKWLRTSGFTKRIEDEVSKRTVKALEDMFGKEDSPIMKAITGAVGKTKPEGDEDKGERNGDGTFKPGRGGKLPPDVEARLAKAEKDSADAKTKLEKAEAARIAAEKKADTDEEKAELRKALSAHVKPTLLDDVVDMLHSKQIARGDADGDGKRAVLWKDKDEHLPLTDGVAAWAKSPKGKEYAPPVNAGGGGTGRTHGLPHLGGGKDSEASDADVGAIIGGALRRA